MSASDDLARLAAAIRTQCDALQTYPLSETRAAQLAEEIAALNDVVTTAARRLAFEDEPSSFAVALRAGTRKSR